MIRRAGLVLAGCLLATPSLALNPPAVPQQLTSWDFVYDMNTPGNPSDDADSTLSNLVGSMLLDVAECNTLPNPTNQPKAPDACGTLTTNIGESGFWLYYDGDAADAPPGGWNAGNAWWRNRLIVRYDTWDDTIWMGKYRPDPADPECIFTTPCSAGVKFCGDIRWLDTDLSLISGGSFDFCASPL